MILFPRKTAREQTTLLRTTNKGNGFNQLTQRLNAIWQSLWLNTKNQQSEPSDINRTEQPPFEEDVELGHHTIRKWLSDNNYRDVLAIIDEIMLEWQRQGKRTRRNWWAVLAGDQLGRSRKIAGREIPVLRAAQIREGRPITPNAICRDENETVETKWETSRWPGEKNK